MSRGLPRPKHPRGLSAQKLQILNSVQLHQTNGKPGRRGPKSNRTRNSKRFTFFLLHAPYLWRLGSIPTHPRSSWNITSLVCITVCSTRTVFSSAKIEFRLSLWNLSPKVCCAQFSCAVSTLIRWYIQCKKVLLRSVLVSYKLQLSSGARTHQGPLDELLQMEKFTGRRHRRAGRCSVLPEITKKTRFGYETCDGNLYPAKDRDAVRQSLGQDVLRIVCLQVQVNELLFVWNPCFGTLSVKLS